MFNQLWSWIRGNRTPRWLTGLAKHGGVGERKAAKKIAQLIRPLELTNQQQRTSYQAELSYQNAKIEAWNQYPHAPEVYKELCDEAKGIRNQKFQQDFSEDQWADFEALSKRAHSKSSSQRKKRKKRSRRD